MAAFIKFLISAVLFLGLLSGGINCQPCGLNNIEVAQSKTGNTIQNTTEWKVTVTNNCICTQTQVKLDCTRFQSLEAVNSSILSVTGSQCLFNNGNPVIRSESISFTYVWDSSFSFTPLSSEVSCS